MAHIHVRIKPQYLTVRIISTFRDSVCFIFFKRFFSSHTQKEVSIITEDKSYFQAVQSREVTANSNTLDVFQYKTNNNKDGRSYTCV